MHPLNQQSLVWCLLLARCLLLHEHLLQGLILEGLLPYLCLLGFAERMTPCVVSLKI